MGKSKDMFIVHCDQNTRGGGVGLIVNTNLNPKQIKMNTILEIVLGEVSEPIQIIVISVYRPPSTPLQGFKQMVNKPTHGSGTIIDHVCMSQTLNTMQTDVTDYYYNDHDCILCLITI